MAEDTGSIPASRLRLHPPLRDHADLLANSFDRIGQTHRLAGQKLADWLVANYQPGQPLDVIVVCTGNSRRSMLGATMGNVAAAYAGLPGIRFHSGGTDPTAFNTRTVRTLQAIGVKIEPTGGEAAKGEAETANPVYRLRWGDAGDPPMETTEFSKRYDDPANPQRGFAALMVCGDADTGCPAVRGAGLRLSMPYDDPKSHDDTASEANAYAERRDDMGRAMLATLMQVRQRLAGVSTAAERTR